MPSSIVTIKLQIDSTSQILFLGEHTLLRVSTQVFLSLVWAYSHIGFIAAKLPAQLRHIVNKVHVYTLLVWFLRFLPTGAPKAAETPAAAPADTKSLFSVSLRKYSKI